MINKLVLLVIGLIFFFITGIVNAGVVPGTIQVSYNTGDKNCPYYGNKYDTSVACSADDANGCKTYTTGANLTKCGCSSYEKCTGSGTGEICVTSSSCQEIAVCNYCSQYKTAPVIGESSYSDRVSEENLDDINDILNDSSKTLSEKNSDISALGCSVGASGISCSGSNAATYTAPAGGMALDNIGCSVTCKGTLHTPANTSTTKTCDVGSASYYSVGGAHGDCSCPATNQLISSFDQSGEITRYSTSDDGTCKVEGRYATTDLTGPTINFDEKGSFLLDSTKWCNLNHFQNGLNVGSCGAYDKIPGGSLVEEFTFTVQDISALSEVLVEFGTCAGQYDFSSLSVSDLIADLYNPSGVQATYKDVVTFKSHTHSTYGGVTLPSLLSAFGKSSMDECLGEGENFLRVVAKDAARLASNINVIDSNTREYSSFTDGYTIRIDNSGADVSINTTSDDPDKWYNHTITGDFGIKDEHKSAIPVCTNYVKTGVGTCPGPLGAHFHWVSPIGVHHKFGTYDIYSCDGVEITSSNQCKQGCNTGYKFDVGDGQCKPKKNIWDFTGSYSTCSGGKQFKEVQCEIALTGSKIPISKCEYPSFASKILPSETVTLSSGADSYYIQRSCP